MLTADFKQNIGNPQAGGVGGAPAPNTPMDTEAFAKWAQPTPPPASAYDVAMGSKNPDGTPNTDRGIIPQAFDQFKKGYEQTKSGANNPDLLKGGLDIGKGMLNEAAGGIRAVFSPVEAITKVVSKLPIIKQLGEGASGAINYVADHISNYKPLQDFMVKNPDAEEVANNVITIAAPLLLSKYVEMRSNLGSLKTDVKTSVEDWNRSIESGDIPMEQIFKDKGGEFQPGAEAHVISDMSAKMNEKMPGLGDLFTKEVNKVGQTPDTLVKQATDFISKHESSGLSTLGDIAKSNMDTLGQKGADLVGKAKGAFSKTPVAPTEAVATLEKSAIRDATPSYNKSLIGEPAVKNADGTTTPRVSEINSKNPFAMRDVASTAQEIAAGKELSKVEGYNLKGTALDKYNTVSADIVKKSEAYRTSLENEKVVIPKKEMTAMIKRTVNETSQNSLLLQKTDPIVKNYIRVAQRAASEVDGTLAGEDQLRLKLDQAYEDAGGKYGNNKGLDQIHRAARNAITKDMETRAQSTQVKASLKQMTDLYRASDVLQDKAAAEGGSKWEQFKKKYPITTKVGGKLLNMAGLGEAVHLAP